MPLLLILDIEQLAVGAVALLVPAMLEIYKMIALVSDSRAAVLITCESGTGKELVARAVHAYGMRCGSPFVAVNCGAPKRADYFRWLPVEICGYDAERSVAKAGADDLAAIFAGLPSIDEVERRYLLHVLEATGGNRKRSAEILGINRRTLYRMAERFQIEL
jgi:DNA-binding NtrC family response regulator